MGLLIYRFCRFVKMRQIYTINNNYYHVVLLTKQKNIRLFPQTHRAIFLHFGRRPGDNDVVPFQLRVRPSDRRTRELSELLVEKSVVH